MREKGFTLIELLIVMAVLALLVTIVIVAINPADKLAQARDTGRKSTLSQLVDAVKNYAVTSGSYPANNSQWANTLVAAGEISAVPAAIPSGNFTSCWGDATGHDVNGYCFVSVSGNFYLWTKLESRSEEAKCNLTVPVYYGFTTGDERICLRCTTYSAACNATQ
jgi:prepilin-type N-terminal cleavage/methylation domain-containing protein